jgi:hypothetical protein
MADISDRLILRAIAAADRPTTTAELAAALARMRWPGRRDSPGEDAVLRTCRRLERIGLLDRLDDGTWRPADPPRLDARLEIRRDGRAFVWALIIRGRCARKSAGPARRADPAELVRYLRDACPFCWAPHRACSCDERDAHASFDGEAARAACARALRQLEEGPDGWRALARDEG